MFIMVEVCTVGKTYLYWTLLFNAMLQPSVMAY